MSELGQLSDLISDIYDAALDAGAWPQALWRTLAVVGGSSALLYAQDAQLTAGNFHCAVGTDRRLDALHLRHYLRELGDCEQSAAVGTVFAASDALAVELLRATRFYREWAAPQGYVDFLGVVLHRSAGSLVRLFINWHGRDGRINDRARDALQLLAAHFQRAIRIGRTAQRSASRAAVLTEVLDSIPTGAILVDSAGRLVHATRAGLQQLADGAVVRWVDGRPRPRDSAMASQLQQALNPGVRRAPRGTAGSRSAAEPCAPGRERLRVQVLALPTEATRDAPAPRAAAAALLIAQPPPDLAQRVQSAARRYEFTPAELRVVQALADGRSIGRIARLLGIGKATVKTHLQHVFDKTDARRQVDLIKLIADAELLAAPAPAALSRGAAGTQSRRSDARCPGTVAGRRPARL